MSIQCPRCKQTLTCDEEDIKFFTEHPEIEEDAKQYIWNLFLIQQHIKHSTIYSTMYYMHSRPEKTEIFHSVLKVIDFCSEKRAREVATGFGKQQEVNIQ